RVACGSWARSDAFSSSSASIRALRTAFSFIAPSYLCSASATRSFRTADSGTSCSKSCIAPIYASSKQLCLRTPRRRPARVALHAGAVAHQREVAALAAGFALVALGAGLGALLRGGVLGLRAHLLRLGAHLELLRRGELGLRLALERGGAGDLGARRRAAEGGDVAAAGRRGAAHDRQAIRARARQALGDVIGGGRGLAFLLALAERVEASLGRIDMREVEALQVGDGKLAEHV